MHIISKNNKILKLVFYIYCRGLFDENYFDGFFEKHREILNKS
jgi:hypothetical protein